MLPWWVSWLTAIGTILSAYLVRRLYWQGFVVGLANQIAWTWLTIATEQWGLLAVGAFMCWNYVQGIRHWRAAGLGRRDWVARFEVNPRRLPLDADTVARLKTMIWIVDCELDKGEHRTSREIRVVA